MPKRLPQSDEALLRELVWRCVAGTQQVKAAAKDLRISPSKAHTILKHARDTGLLQVSVQLELEPEREVAQRVLDRWRDHGVTDVVILPSPVDDRELMQTPPYETFVRDGVALLAADYVAKLLESGSHLCLGGGQILLSFARKLTPKTLDLVVRPLCARGYWRPFNAIDPATVLQALYARFAEENSDLFRVYYPNVAPGLVLEEARRRPDLRALFDESVQRPQVCVSEVGRIWYHRASGVRYDPPRRTPKDHQPERMSSYVRVLGDELQHEAVDRTAENEENLSVYPASFFGDPTCQPGDYREAYRRLVQAGAVAALGWHCIDDQGAVVRGYFLDSTGVGVEPKTLRTWTEQGTTSIAVAYGSASAPALRAALTGHYFNVVITDLALALQLLVGRGDPQLPGPYGHIPAIPTDPGEPRRTDSGQA